MTTAKKPNLFDANDYEIFVARIHQLKADTQPKWGKMNAAQMLTHCREIQEACNGKPLEGTPFIVKLFKGFIKKAVLNDKPYPKSSQTHPQYIITDEREFEQEKQLFLASLEKFVQNAGSAEHTLFGTISQKERNQAVYKHHNHHLEQFGV